MPRFFLTATAALLIAFPSLDAVAEDVEHPNYRSWTRFPVGTTITLRSVTTSRHAPIITTTRTTLIALEAEKAVLEIQDESDATGKLDESRSRRYEQRRLFPLFPGIKKEQIGQPSGAIARGEETLTVAGREYKAQWFDSKGRTEVGETFTRTWMSDAVPGRLIKAVTKVPAANITTTDELTAIKTP